MCLFEPSQKEIKKHPLRPEIITVSVVSFFHPIPLWKCRFLPPVLQFTTRVWPSKLSFFNSFSTFNLGRLFRLQGWKERQWEYYDRHCPGESLRASKDAGCLLAGWQIVDYRHQANLPRGHRDIMLKDLHRYGLHWSRLLTPPVGLLILHWCLRWNSQRFFISLSHTHTHTNICQRCCFCWCKSLLAK